MTDDMPQSDDAIRRSTGKGWDEWFELLNAWGGADKTHTEIATYINGELGVESQTIELVAGMGHDQISPIALVRVGVAVAVVADEIALVRAPVGVAVGGDSAFRLGSADSVKSGAQR